MPTKVEKADLEDRLRGIAKGQEPVDLNYREREPEVVPDITELGLSLARRHQLEITVSEHAGLGLIRKDAESRQKPLTEKIKGMLTEWSVEAKAFLTPAARVSMYPQSRSSISKQSLLEALTKHRVPAAKIQSIIQDATLTNETITLRVTPYGEAE